MNVIKENQINCIRQFNFGAFSYVYQVELNGIEYAYKKYNDFFSSSFLNAIVPLMEEKLPEEFLIPKFIVESTKGTNRGYLSLFKDNLQELDEVYEKNIKIKCLKNARDLLEELHKTYKIVHGDIHGGNVQFDVANLKPYFLDFDMSFHIGEELTNKKERDFSDNAYFYLKYGKLDYNLDVYMFNLMTLSLMSGMYSESEILELLQDGSLDMRDMNADVKRLSKELVWDNSKKEYSGEYIIDYF